MATYRTQRGNSPNRQLERLRRVRLVHPASQVIASRRELHLCRVASHTPHPCIDTLSRIAFTNRHLLPKPHSTFLLPAVFEGFKTKYVSTRTPLVQRPAQRFLLYTRQRRGLRMGGVALLGTCSLTCDECPERNRSTRSRRYVGGASQNTVPNDLRSTSALRSGSACVQSSRKPYGGLKFEPIPTL